MKYLSITLLIFLGIAGCQSKPQDDPLVKTISESSDKLVASAGPKIVLMKEKNHQLTNADRKRLERHYPKTLEKIQNYQKLSVQDIINLTRSGVSDQVIIHEMGLTQSIFYLTPEDESLLDQAGVSKTVIDAMRDTSDTRY